MKFLADENFDNRIMRGILRRQPDIDIVRVQDLEIAGADDLTVLAWAAQAGRILLTHDERTIPHYVYERVATVGQLHLAISAIAIPERSCAMWANRA
jgi:predicted nuclease of predicted toxin-antitoxin system